MHCLYYLERKLMAVYFVEYMDIKKRVGRKHIFVHI